MLRIRCRFSEGFMRRILLGLLLLAASLSAHPFDRNQGSAQAQQIVLPCVPSGNSCIPVSAANPLPTTGGGGGGGITPGTTTCTSCTANNLLYTDGTLVQELVTANSGVLVTSAGGVPSISTTLPSGLTIPGYLTSLVIGATPITGGATTQCLFNLSGVLSSDSGCTYAGSGGAFTLSGAALGATTALTINPASASGNLALFQVNGTTEFSISAGGVIQPNTRIISPDTRGTSNSYYISSGGYSAKQTGSIQWTGSADATAAATTALWQASAGVMEIGNATTANALGSLLLANLTASGIVNPNSSSTPTAGSGAASVAGNDQRFVVTAGTAQTSITVNFGHTWAAAPVCTLSSNSTASVVDIASIGTTAVTFGASVALTGALLYVLCFGG
jgi:hypothetical protein